MSYSKWPQAKINLLSEIVSRDLETLFAELGVDVHLFGNTYIGTCCVHGGDNNTAINIYSDGFSLRGNWRCNTHSCESVFQNSIIGFTRGVLSRQNHNWSQKGDRMYEFFKTLSFLCGLYKVNEKDLKVNLAEEDKKAFIKQGRIISATKTKGFSPAILDKLLDIPSEYYINRGYSSDILTRYKIGLCSRLGREMTGRVVFPIWSEDKSSIIGCSGRLVQGEGPKWLHSKGFSSKHTFYNLWEAGPHIKASKTAILVESPGNCLRLEESGIRNSLGLFGVSLSDPQQFLLEKMGVMNLIVCLDPDDAGRKGIDEIIQRCRRYYNIKVISLPNGKDVADLSAQEIKELFGGIG